MIASVRGSKCSVSCTTGSPAAQQPLLARDLGADAALDEAERVHVLELGLRAELRRCRPGGCEMLASQRSEPSSMFTSLTPSRRSVVRSSRSHSRACSARAHVGLGDDLGERRAAAVEVDDRGVRAVDPAARADVDELRRVLLEVHAVDAHVAEPPAAAQRLVVLADLVALGQVGIEVVLAVEDRARRELGAERQADHQPEVDRLGVRHRQRRRAGRGRPGRCACSAARRSSARSSRTSSCACCSWTWISRPMTGSKSVMRRPVARRRAVEADRLLERVGRVEQRGSR